MRDDTGTIIEEVQHKIKRLSGRTKSSAREGPPALNVGRVRLAFGARMLHLTQPPFIICPQYWIDGQEHMASWTDYPASGWGRTRTPG
jgi:hypothetical protein